MGSSNVQLLVLLVLVTLLSMKYLTFACDIETARATANRNRLGGWSGVAVDDDSVVQLKQTVVNDATVVKAHRVIESYKQVGHVTSVIIIIVIIIIIIIIIMV